MKIINILKPDALGNIQALVYYFESIIKFENVSSIKLYELTNWTRISSLIYEYDVVHGKDEKLIHRKKLLTSISGYYHIFNNQPGIVVLLDVKNDIDDILKKLYILKKKIRQLFVSNNDLYYLKFLNINSNILNLPLYDIKVPELRVDIKRFPSNAPYDNIDYSMIYFNIIHSPDPSDLGEVMNSLNILEEEKVISNSKLIKVLKSEI